MSSTNKLARVTIAVAVLMATAGAARAQGDAAAAEQLYKEAKALTAKGNYAEACPKFEASYKIDKGLGTLVNLADCHEHVGKLATAWAEWTEAVDLAKREQDKRAKYAEDRRSKVEPRLPKLTIEVKNPVASLRVYRGDTELVPASFGLPLPVDPGEVVVTVRRGDKVLDTQTVTVKEKEVATLSLDLGAIDQAHPDEGPSGPGPEPPAPVIQVVERPVPAPAPSSQKTIGYVVGGAGVAALIGAGILEGVALSKKSKADQPDQCVNKYCSPSGFDTVESAKKYATIGQWVGVGGVLLTAVGATLVLTAPSQSEQKSGKAAPFVAASPWITPSAGGLSVAGSL
jgi:hypothetical protein